MTTPYVATTRAELATALDRTRAVVLVPTMGALHEGHASLMQVARSAPASPVSRGNRQIVVSIFVNPTQFGAGEDLDRYPRTLEADLKLCEREGVDVVFAPSVTQMYPAGPGAGVTLDPGPLGSVLEGATRPGHFAGVLTVVAKLFGLVRPDVAVFGQKDYQQLVLIRRMVADLCLGIEVVGAPTQRESDGLALSSRNRFLDDTRRHQALALSRALTAAQQESTYDAALAAASDELDAAEGVDLDYLVITDPDLGPATTGEARVILAAKLGTTRLIDNAPLRLGER